MKALRHTLLNFVFLLFISLTLFPQIPTFLSWSSSISSLSHCNCFCSFCFSQKFTITQTEARCKSLLILRLPLRFSHPASLMRSLFLMASPLLQVFSWLKVELFPAFTINWRLLDFRSNSGFFGFFFAQFLTMVSCTR